MMNLPSMLPWQIWMEPFLNNWEYMRIMWPHPRLDCHLISRWHILCAVVSGASTCAALTLDVNYVQHQKQPPWKTSGHCVKKFSEIGNAAASTYSMLETGQGQVCHIYLPLSFVFVMHLLRPISGAVGAFFLFKWLLRDCGYLRVGVKRWEGPESLNTPFKCIVRKRYGKVGKKGPDSKGDGWWSIL